MPTILLNKIKPGGKTLTNLKVGSTEVKYVKRGDGKLFYDTLNYYSYGTPSVSLSYPSGNTSAAGGTKSPTVTYSLSKTPYGHSGTSYSASTLNSGASSITYSLNNTSNGASINATTGVVTWSANETLDVREVIVTVTVTVNSIKGTGTFTLKLDADSVKSTAISLDSNNYKSSAAACAYSGGTCTITAKVTKTWVSGDVTYDKPTLSSSNTGFTMGSLNSSYQCTGTWGSHTSTSERTTTITASYSGATSKTLKLYQAGNSSTSTEYETPVIESVTSIDVPASGGTTSNSYYTVKFYQRKRTVYADGTTGSWVYAYPSGSVATTTMITANITLTGNDLATTIKERTKLGTVTVQVTANSKKSSGKNVDVYQLANTTTLVTTELTPTLSYAGMSSASGQTATPTIGYVWKYYTLYTSGDKSDTFTVNSPNGPGVSAMSPQYSINDTTYFSINASTGVVTTKSENTSTTTDRTAIVTVILTFGGKTGTATATVLQSKKAGTYDQAWAFSVFNVSNYIYSFGFRFKNANGNTMTLTGGGGSGGTNNPSRSGTSSISTTYTSMFRPDGFYLTDMNSTYSSASNSSGYYQDGTTGKYYYVRWSYGTAPTTSNYTTHGYKFYSGIVESWTYSASTLYVWAYQV